MNAFNGKAVAMSVEMEPSKPRTVRPLCMKCGWAMGGVDSWSGGQCKCGHQAPPCPLPSELEAGSMATNSGRDMVAKDASAELVRPFLLLAIGRAEAMGQEMKAVQLVWPDEENRLPWEDGFNAGLRDHQPPLAGV